MEDKGTALIAWDKVCKSKDQGGLGVLDLIAQNKALLLKHLHKFFNCHDLPWVKFIYESYYTNRQVDCRPIGSFWWKSMIKLISIYKSFAKCKVGNGSTILLWTDSWNSHICRT